MAGRKPIPTKLKILRGTDKKDPQRINRDEPQPAAKPPRMPSWLDDAAKKKWKEMVKQLREIDVLTVIDGDLLAVYCQAWSDMLKAQDAVAKTGQAIVKTDKDGQPVVQANPFAVQLRSLRETIMRIAVEFGLTPSSRSKVKVNTPKKNHGFTPRRRKNG